MTVINFSDYAKEKANKGEPLCITFYSAKFCNVDGKDLSVNVTVTVEHGDVSTVLDVVKEKGGLLQIRGEESLYIPWPCACVVIHAPDKTPFENS
jgi:hypothetical protein